MAAPLATGSISSTVGFGPETRLLIDGALVGATGGGTFDNINPATEEVLGQVSDAVEADVHRAIGAARRAFDTTDWSTNHSFRQKCLLQLHEALGAERDDARAELIAEAGAPMATTYIAQFDWPVNDALKVPADMISTFEWERNLPDSSLLGAPSRRTVRKEAIGVVAAITPWNFPIEIVLNKLGQALATGNTVVLKPAPDTPWTATRLGRLIAEKTDIPAGVVNIVTTSDNSVAELLVTDPRVDMISFTGSTATGRRIVAASAPTMKRTFMELGGKSALIVLEDADLAASVPNCIVAGMHAGQGCALTTRLLVPRSKYAEAVEMATTTFRAITYGDPTQPETFCGPVISARQRERVLGYIEKGKNEGARVTIGGGAPPELDRGYFVMPTVFADVDNSMTIAQEEIFGPVLTITAFDGTDDDAVRIANDSPYGLAATIFGSPDRASAVANRLRVGSVMMNGALYYGADAPFGGYKLSGNGRQNGTEGFEQHLETKTIAHP